MFDEIYDSIILQEASSPDGRFKLIAPHTLIDTLDDSDPPEPYMVDSPEERLASKEFVEKAKGKVLQFGLGIGLTAKALEKKDEVDSVLIIEKNQWVIDEISSQLQFGEKVQILQGDLFYFMEKFPVEPKYNSIFIDISTPGWELEEYRQQGVFFTREEMAEKLKPYLVDGGWIDYFRPMKLPVNSDGK
jgi:hypothetical protein